MNMELIVQRMGEVVSLDQRRHAPTTNGILVFGKDDELREGILDLSGNFGFQWVRGLRRQEENTAGEGLWNRSALARGERRLARIP
jgi:hypothetical protein